jgi:hypothetical protein
MGTVRLISYTERRYGESGRHARADVNVSSHDDGDGTATSVIVAMANALSCRATATGPVDDAINGRRTSFRTGLSGAFLSAKEPAGETAIAVDDDDGFAAGDPIAIFNTSSDGVPTSPEYHLVDSVAANVITLAGSGLTGAMYEGARIVNLADRAFDVAVGIDGRPGVKSQLTAPSAVSIAIVEDSGDIAVTITANDEDEATHFDTYVRDARFRKIEPGWVPDDADRTDVASAFNVTTFEGGADCVPDGGGGALVSSGTYYVAVVAKNGAGVRDVDESGMSNVEEITLA